MTLTRGARLGPYEIVESLGTGGMGEVYSPRDTRLNRLVAIKVVPEAFARRFEREGKTLAAMNHPNICAVYDVGPNYLPGVIREDWPLPDPKGQPLDRAREIREEIRTRVVELVASRGWSSSSPSDVREETGRDEP